MAVNPAAFEMKSKEMIVQPPEGDNVTHAQMKTKHRNAFPIGNFLLHFIWHIKSYSNYKCLSTDEDCQLDASILARGPIPIWIKHGETISDLEVFQYILDKLLMDITSVTLLHSPYKELPQEVINFCQKQRWKTCTFWNMTGSEDECIITVVEDNYAFLETFSRAKNKLIIITK